MAAFVCRFVFVVASVAQPAAVTAADCGIWLLAYMSPNRTVARAAGFTSSDRGSKRRTETVWPGFAVGIIRLSTSREVDESAPVSRREHPRCAPRRLGPRFQRQRRTAPPPPSVRYHPARPGSCCPTIPTPAARRPVPRVRRPEPCVLRASPRRRRSLGSTVGLYGPTFPTRAARLQAPSARSLKPCRFQALPRTRRSPGSTA